MPESTIATVTSPPVVCRHALAAPIGASPCSGHCSSVRGSVAGAWAARALAGATSGRARRPSGARTALLCAADAPEPGATARATSRVVVARSARGAANDIRPPCRGSPPASMPRRTLPGSAVAAGSRRHGTRFWPDGRWAVRWRGLRPQRHGVDREGRHALEVRHALLHLVGGEALDALGAELL